MATCEGKSAHTKKKVDGLYICGSTGQGICMSVEERISVAENVAKIITEDKILIVHIGCQSLPDAKKLLSNALSLNAKACSSIIPSQFNKIEEIFFYLKRPLTK